MKRILHHIERAREKPHHVRKRLALASAGAVTGLVGLVWLVGGISAGSFAIEASSFADAIKPREVETVSADTRNLAGAASAFADDEGPARIEIVDAATTTKKKPEPTIIPF